jgi:hypothetical protein
VGGGEVAHGVPARDDDGGLIARVLPEGLEHNGVAAGNKIRIIR